jgi:hypothetical protein
MLKKIAQTENYKNLFSILFFAITAAAFFIFGSTSSFQITTNFWSNNNFASPNTTLFTPASRVLFTIEYRYLALALLLILGLKIAYKSYLGYKKAKKNSKKLFNKIDLNLDSFCYSAFLVFICLLAGLQDISAAIFVLVSSFVGIRLVLSNNPNQENDNHINIKNWAILLVSLSWLLVIIYSIGSMVYGDVRSTWYVYLLDFISLIYLLFLTLKDSKPGFLKKFKATDRDYIKYYADLLLKIAFLVVLVIGIHK